MWTEREDLATQLERTVIDPRCVLDAGQLHQEINIGRRPPKTLFKPFARSLDIADAAQKANEA